MPNLQIVVHPDRLGVTSNNAARDAIVFGLKLSLFKDMLLGAVRLKLTPERRG